MDRWTRIAGTCLVGTTIALTACSGGSTATSSSSSNQNAASQQSAPTAAPDRSASQASAAANTAPAAPPRVIDPCTLATAAEVSTVVGKLRSGPTPLKSQTGDVLECKFITDAGNIVAISIVDAANWEFRKSFYEDDEGTVNLAGLGEEAFFGEKDHQPGITQVLHKPFILEVSASLASEKDDQEATKAIAATALSRI